MNRILASFIFICMAALHCTASASAQSGGTVVQFPEQQNAVTVKLVRISDVLAAPMRINGRDVGLFIVDTGTNAPIIDRKLAEELGLSAVGGGGAHAVGGNIDIAVYPVQSLAIGDFTLKQTGVLSADLSDITDKIGNVRGLIGASVLSHVPFTIDVPAAELTFYRPEAFVPPEGVEAVELKVRKNRPRVRVDFGHDVWGWFVLDSGAGAHITVGEYLVEVHSEYFKDHSWRRSTIYGMGGISRLRVVDIDVISMLGEQWKNERVSFAHDGRGATPGRADGGMIGMRLLQNHRLTFDFANRRLWSQRMADGRPREWDDPDFDPHAPDPMGITPLMRAVGNGYIEDIKRFLAAEVDLEAVETGETTTAFIHAVAGGNPQIVKLLMDAGAQTNIETVIQMKTPLMIAAERGHHEVVAMLMEVDAPVNAEDVFGQTALVMAAEAGHLHVVKQLLAFGAQVNHVSRTFGSALHAAAYHGHVDIVKHLLDQGAEVDVLTAHDRQTALVIAVANGHESTARLLLDAGAAVDHRDEQGRTSLMGAASNGELACVRLLLAHGADPTLRDREGRQAVTYASRSGDMRVVSLLYEYANAD